MDKTPFSNWLLGQLKAKGWSQADMARASGLTPQAISNYINRVVQKPDEDALAAIARGLRLPVQEVYRAAGILPPDLEMDEETMQMMHLFEKMTEEQQEEMIALAKFFVERRERKNPRQARAEG